MGAELFHVDRQTGGQTDMTKLIFAFHNFVNAAKSDQWIHLCVFIHWNSVLCVIINLCTATPKCICFLFDDFCCSEQQ